MFRECLCQIVSPGVAITLLQRSGEGQGGEEPGEEDQREEGVFIHVSLGHAELNFI